MDDSILITELNDFIFCPASIYFHKLYGGIDRMLYQSAYQINGSAAHETVDTGTYTTRKDIFSGMDVYSEEYHVIGKIDIYDEKKEILRERKKYIKRIYDGYIYQVYAQYFALKEMGYSISRIELYSMDDHKEYAVPLPEEAPVKFAGFKKVIEDIRLFRMEDFMQDNIEKCRKCIYESACDRSLL